MNVHFSVFLALLFDESAIFVFFDRLFHMILSLDAPNKYSVVLFLIHFQPPDLLFFPSIFAHFFLFNSVSISTLCNHNHHFLYHNKYNKFKIFFFHWFLFLFFILSHFIGRFFSFLPCFIFFIFPLMKFVYALNMII